MITKKKFRKPYQLLILDGNKPYTIRKLIGRLNVMAAMAMDMCGSIPSNEAKELKSELRKTRDILRLIIRTTL